MEAQPVQAPVTKAEVHTPVLPVQVALRIVKVLPAIMEVVKRTQLVAVCIVLLTHVEKEEMDVIEK